MYVEVSPSGGVSVREPDELGELAVRAPGLEEEDVSEALASAGCGSVDNGHAWLKIHELRARAGAQPAEWVEAFEGMIDFARSRGWLTQDGERVQAHIEYLR